MRISRGGAANAAILILAFLLCGCAPQAKTFVGADTAPVATAVKQLGGGIKEAATVAQGIEAHGTAAGSAEAKDLVFKLTVSLRQVDGLNIQVADLTQQIATTTQAGNAEIARQTGRADSAEAQVKASEPRHRRDIWALGFMYFLGAAVIEIAPLLREGYPPLEVIPVALIRLAGVAAGAMVAAGIAGILIFLGVI